jgi:(2S)-methylsuccinyl-CoA dehydrogenase
VKCETNLIETCDDALAAAKVALRLGKVSLLKDIASDGRVDQKRLQVRQHASHGLAWFATYCTALEELLAWAVRLERQGLFAESESLLLQISFGEYFKHLTGGLPMSQCEFAHWRDLGIQDEVAELFSRQGVKWLLENGSTPSSRAALSKLLVEGATLSDPLASDELDMVRAQFHRFADEKVLPNAMSWHKDDALIPLTLIDEMAHLGVFGLTIDEDAGGVGMGKVAMCVVTEELSRASLAVGSLATRSEIAAELIQTGGTDDQRKRWLPAIASGAVLPTAVFTEPNTGSDLANVRTRAVKRDGVYSVTGSKTWITHAARADLMTLLVRTGTVESGYKGLSMLLAEKTRGTEEHPFQDTGLGGTEIKVLGYRGMREYELGFDGFSVGESSLLGNREGEGFKQLMATFEAARIQTAARAVGVAQRALELAIVYSRDRVAFGRPISDFQRVSGKIAVMAAEVMMARQLTYAAARKKDQGVRCDVDAGMAKLLAARVAWSNADCALQIHGGNGYAEEYEISRILVDARILNIFEGAAEIQAQVVVRGILETATVGV